MLNSQKEFRFLFGWDDFFESQLPGLNLNSHSVLARVICEERNLYRVQSNFNEVFWASVRGKLQFEAAGRVHFPAVGDWVLVERPPGSDRGVVHHVLSRKTVIHRKQVGASSDAQILAANVDFIFIATSLNADLNIGRIHRYLIIAKESQATPILLLTKADLCHQNLSDVVDRIQNEFSDVSIHTVTSEHFEEARFLKELLVGGTTSVFLGSSGVGKSTLVNYLIGEEVAKTQDIREDDQKGRHTTTSRQLYVSQFGGLVIDTPGMRELQLSDHEEGLQTQFSDIEALMQTCRFSDCGHQTEPGCAILQALADESLSETDWQSYQKLASEIQRERRKHDKGLVAEERKKWKKRSQAIRNCTRFKKGEIW